MAVLTPFPETRSKAARVRALAQVAALLAAVVAGGAVAANFLSSSDPVLTAPVEIRPLNPTKYALPPDANQGKADLEGIGSRMMLVSNSPKIAEVVKTDQMPPPVAPPSSVKDHVKFLGVVADGAKFSALIAVDGKQRIVAVGDIIKMSGDQTATVTAITGDSITFDDGKKTETIELAHHTSSVVGHSTAPVVGPTGAMVPTAVGAGKGALDRRGPTRAKPAKDPLAGLDPKARAIVDENNARAALESREVRRKAQRIQLEKETGRTGEEIEKLLDLQEQTGKLDLNSKEVENKGKGGK